VAGAAHVLIVMKKELMTKATSSCSLFTSSLCRRSPFSISTSILKYRAHLLVGSRR
jgi:hypothetical protein